MAHEPSQFLDPYVEMLSTITPEVTVAVISTIPYSTEDKTRGADVVTVLQDLARR